VFNLATKHSSAALISHGSGYKPTAEVPVQEFVGAPCYFVFIKVPKIKAWPNLISNLRLSFL